MLLITGANVVHTIEIIIFETRNSSHDIIAMLEGSAIILIPILLLLSFLFFFFNDPATPEIYPFPLPAVLPIFCLALAADPAFLADDDRRIYLLPALAAVRPMSQAAIAAFRQANAEGYYNLNVLLLAKNGSALEIGRAHV